MRKNKPKRALSAEEKKIKKSLEGGNILSYLEIANSLGVSMEIKKNPDGTLAEGRGTDNWRLAGLVDKLSSPQYRELSVAIRINPDKTVEKCYYLPDEKELLQNRPGVEFRDPTSRGSASKER